MADDRLDAKIETAVPAAPPRPANAHKGTFGTVIVFGGCQTMIGAPALAASAALRGGAGLVKIASTPEVVPLAITIEPGATGIMLPQDPDKISSLLDELDSDGRAVLAVGPGMGRDAAAGSLVASLWADKRAKVVDADGLNMLAAGGVTGTPGVGPAVMTPHPGEFRRLAAEVGITDDPTDTNTRPLAAAKLALAYQVVVVLKGHHSVVSNGQRTYINTTGNPSLSTAGTGDVLTGLVAALIAQHMSPFDASVLGVYLHGRAADHWSARCGASGLTARDLADLLPATMQDHRQMI